LPCEGLESAVFSVFSAETEESGRYLRTMAAILYFSGEALYAGFGYRYDRSGAGQGLILQQERN